MTLINILGEGEGKGGRGIGGTIAPLGGRGRMIGRIGGTLAPLGGRGRMISL